MSARRTLIPMVLASPRNLIGIMQGWIRCAANGDAGNAGVSVLLWCNTCCVGVTLYAKVMIPTCLGSLKLEEDILCSC